MKVFNYGDMQRDFTYIDDIVNGMFSVMKNPPTEKTKHPYYKLYNIGNSQPIRLMDFIETLENELGKEANKEMLPMQPGDVYSTFANTHKLSFDVGYRPNTPITLGVKKFVQWFKEQDIL